MVIMAEIITKLLPILHVRDPHAERDFYLRLGLGLRTTYEGSEYPDFLGVSDIEAVIEACGRAGLRFDVATEHPRPDWSYRTVTVRAPSGMDVLFEEQSPRD